MVSRKKAYTKKWPRKNLGELANFLDRTYPDGYSLEDLASVTGLTVQNISAMFSRDDAKLSRMEEIARRFGCNLRLFFPEKVIPIRLHNPKEDKYPNAGNLRGLYRYILDNNKSINYVSQRIGKANLVLLNAFKKGDIFISTLYDVINVLNIEVYWVFEKNEDKN